MAKNKSAPLKTSCRVPGITPVAKFGPIEATRMTKRTMPNTRLPVRLSMLNLQSGNSISVRGLPVEQKVYTRLRQIKPQLFYTSPLIS